ncbi:MAG: pyrroline-5-carboxylate reductase [Ilumatobacteraceae bacterium]|jgi:pyrroline-5-carboxylate reductase
MSNFRLAVVGGGNMGAALLGGLVANGWATSDLAVVEVSDARREALTSMYPGVAVSATVPPSEAAVIAVKPYDAADAASAAAAAGARRVLSIAAGVSINTLQQACGNGVAVVRSIPNTPALLGKGAAAMCAGDFATEDDLDWAEGILGAVGTVVRVAEPLLDAVTGLVGSGPAYLFLVAEALTDAGVLAGLTRPVADALVRQLFVGSAAMLAQYGDPVALRAMVTSPGGTTAAGLRVLEEQGVRSALMECVLAATERSRELGQPH